MSFSFNGTTSDVRGSPATIVNNAEPFTLAAWIAPDGAGEGSAGRIAGKDSGGNPGTWFFGIGLDAATALRFRRTYATTNLDVTGSSGEIKTDGSFQHVAMTWDGSTTAANVFFYINGVQPSVYNSRTNGAGAKTSDAAFNFEWGNRMNGDRTFNGRIAHAHFFRRVLSQNEIQSLMVAPAIIGPRGALTASTSGLVQYLPMDALVGTIVLDLSGRGTDVTASSVTVDSRNPPCVQMYGSRAPLIVP